MTRELHELERNEHRVLGAIEVVDGTSGARVTQALQVSGGEARIVRNRSGLYVVWGWSVLADHAGVFARPPAEPGIGSQELVLTLRDPAGAYLPRSAVMALPRNPAPDPASRAHPDSLFRPLQVRMYRSTAAPLQGNWSRLDVNVAAAAGGDALGGALVEVRDSGGDVLARGLTDWRGEAVVPVAGVPITTWSDDENAVVVSEVAATVHAFFVPALGTRTPAEDVHRGRAPAAVLPPDPDRTAAHAQVLSAQPVPIQLAARRARVVALAIAFP